ncbi:Piriformospora indica-insensitive protein 2 [Platanthera zijinensis]|uniref:Piriformospora indica-insensitive protein 2 n=1 Tax=Platanthera zijinensis TaxID=2320716 RepID=A0AAP0B5E0_9ASPA
MVCFLSQIKDCSNHGKARRRSMMRGDVAVRILLILLLCFQVLSQSDGSTAPMEEKEKKALYSTIQGFVGDGWNGSELYPDPCGWASIQGVSCDLFDNGLWYITAVSIGPVSDNSLECSENAAFSPSLFELSHLKSLVIFDCFSSPVNQTTHIPSQDWNKLSSSLETLEFRSNRGISGQIPPVLGQLVNLQSLILTQNSLSGEIPRELGNLARLKRLTLSYNQLSGRVPASLGENLGDLLIMDISSNSLTGPLPSSLGGLASVLKFDLSNNFLSGNLPLELCKLKKLTLLDLRNNNISGGLPPSLQGMISLQYMILCNNPLGGSMKQIDWKILKNLTHLDLSNTSLVGDIPSSIAESKKMRFIALDSNRLSGFVSVKLAAMSNLCALYLHGNNLTGELKFSEEFYERMGTRFSSWNNPNLCYRFEADNGTGEGPERVSKCRYGVKNFAHDLDLGNRAGREKTTHKCLDCIDSTGISASSSSSSIVGFLWIVTLFLMSFM